MVPDHEETPRLRLEPFAEHHLTERYAGWLNDPQVTRYSEQRHRRHTLETCRAYWQSFLGSPNRLWAIVVKAKQIGHIGNINAYVDPNNAVADLGIMIGERSVWGQGFAMEAWMAVCDRLLRREGLRKVTAGTLETNVAMLRVMARVGMVDDGRRVRHYVWEGQEVDIVHAALFRQQWVARYPQGPWPTASP